MVVILPLVGMVVSQIAGLFFLAVPLVLVAAAAFAAIDLVVLKIGVALFEREGILTRWN